MNEKRRLLVIGASGLLGSKLMLRAGQKYNVAGSYNPQVDGKTAWRLEPLDIGSKDDVEKLFDKTKPEVVILCAAMTNVDACEKQPLVANRVNATGPELVARACRRSIDGLRDAHRGQAGQHARDIRGADLTTALVDADCCA